MTSAQPTNSLQYTILSSLKIDPRPTKVTAQQLGRLRGYRDHYRCDISLTCTRPQSQRIREVNQTQTTSAIEPGVEVPSRSLMLKLALTILAFIKQFQISSSSLQLNSNFTMIYDLFQQITVV
jgi:hypothetical protein